MAEGSTIDQPKISVEPIRRDPLDGMAIAVRNRLSVMPGPPMARFALRGEMSAAKAIAKHFGAPLPIAINSALERNGRTILMLGPDEWLLLAPEEETLKLDTIEGISKPYSLVDVGHRNVSVLVSGMLTSEILASVCMLDLDLEAFPVGMATRTLLIKAEAVLWRIAPDRFHIEIWRSFADYLFGLLGEAAREYVKG